MEYIVKYSFYDRKLGETSFYTEIVEAKSAKKAWDKVAKEKKVIREKFREIRELDLEDIHKV